jgi:hypothetical protein
VRDREFADSLLEQRGFELLVPLTTETLFRMPYFAAPSSTPSEARSAPVRGEADGSNPAPSTGESGANPTFGKFHALLYRRRLDAAGMFGCRSTAAFHWGG